MTFIRYFNISEKNYFTSTKRCLINQKKINYQAKKKHT